MWQIYLNYHQRMGILPLKKRVNRDKCSFATKQRMFGVFAIDEILRYRWAPLFGSRTLCHTATNKTYFFKSYLRNFGKGWFCPGLTLGLCVVVFKCVITITNGSAFTSTNYLVGFINKKQVKLATFLSVARDQKWSENINIVRSHIFKLCYFKSFFYGVLAVNSWDTRQIKWEVL